MAVVVETSQLICVHQCQESLYLRAQLIQFGKNHAGGIAQRAYQRLFMPLWRLCTLNSRTRYVLGIRQNLTLDPLAQRFCANFDARITPLPCYRLARARLKQSSTFRAKSSQPVQHDAVSASGKANIIHDAKVIGGASENNCPS